MLFGIMLAAAESGASGGVGAQIDEIVALAPKATNLATIAWDFAMANPLTAIGVIATMVTVGVGIIASIRAGIH